MEVTCSDPGLEPQRLDERVDDRALVVVGELVVQRQDDRAAGQPLGVRKRRVGVPGEAVDVASAPGQGTRVTVRVPAS